MTPNESVLSPLLGKPFKWFARGPDAYDCYGLMIEASRRVGLYIPSDYQTIKDKDPAIRHNSFITGLMEYTIEIPEPEPYCLVTFIMDKEPPYYVNHIGMVMPNLYQFLHVMKDIRVGKERLDNKFYWKNRVDAFWRIKEKLK